MRDCARCASTGRRRCLRGSIAGGLAPSCSLSLLVILPSLACFGRSGLVNVAHQNQRATRAAIAAAENLRGNARNQFTST